MINHLRRASFNNFSRYVSSSPQSNRVPQHPELQTEYLCNPSNAAEITANITRRKGVGDIKLVHELTTKLNKSPNDLAVKSELLTQLLKIPNKTHPAIKDYSDEPTVVKLIGEERKFDFTPREFQDITKKLRLVRTEHLGNVAGSKSYYILGELAELEHALIQFTLANLIKRQFKLISVPDILDRQVIECCGMSTSGDRTQVYSLDKQLHGDDLCLSGTSEMAIAGYFANKTIPVDELPIRLATVSRCYRAETSSIADEKGIYRVHQFTKVEMFAVSTPELSESILEEFRSIEEENFSSLGLHLRTLDMPPSELGAPAFRKYDVEAWMPGRKMFGEVSSCSNCTDYQSRRLGIRYYDKDELKYVHTLNGTACAIPRMLIALVETYQNDNGTIDIPEPLQRFMGGKKKFSKQKQIPELKLVKNTKGKVDGNKNKN